MRRTRLPPSRDEDFFDRLEPERLTRYYIKRLERLGHKVTLEIVAACSIFSEQGEVKKNTSPAAGVFLASQPT